MKLRRTAEEKQQRREEKEQEREARQYRKAKHRIAAGMVLFKDRTYIAVPIDIDKDKTVTVDGFEYQVPDIPYYLKKWWPFKARTFKRLLFPDEHYSIIWNELNWRAIDITWAQENAEHKNIMPSSWGGLLRETGFAQSVNSMKAKNKLAIDRKWIVLIVIVVAVVAVITILGTGVLG